MNYGIQTGRNPFARENVRKRKTSGTCSWCGSSRNGKVWQYYVDPDSGRIADIRGSFCNVSCLNSYHS